MIYIDYNGDRNCRWSDIPETLQEEAARSLLEHGKFLLIINGWWCKLEKQERTFLEGILGISTVALPKRDAAPETMQGNASSLKRPRLGGSQQMDGFRALVKMGYVRAAWIAEASGLKPYQVSRLAKRAIKAGWLVKDGADYAMRFKTGRPRKL